MKRLLLPALSIFCLLLIGVILLGFFCRLRLTLTCRYPALRPPTKVDWISVGIAYGQAAIEYIRPYSDVTSTSETTVTLDAYSFHLDNCLKVNQHIEWITNGSTPPTAWGIYFPAWPLLFPLMLPPILWHRRRRRDRNAAARGFPIDEHTPPV